MEMKSVWRLWISGDVQDGKKKVGMWPTRIVCRDQKEDVYRINVLKQKRKKKKSSIRRD